MDLKVDFENGVLEVGLKVDLKIDLNVDFEN